MTRCAALALTSVLTGCLAGNGAEEDLTDTDFVTPVSPYIVGNGMQKKHIFANGIMASPAAVNALINYPLHSDTFDPSSGPIELTSQPATQDNQVFVRHLVECALDTTMYVKFQGIEYQGAVGLATDWHKNPPNNEELELVSGCMIALNNKLGVSVLTSLRGKTYFDDPLSTSGPIHGYAYGSNVTATPLASFFTGCTPAQTGPNRNCGWPEDKAFVGTCTPGSLVHVGAGAKVGDCANPLGSANSNTVLRVCSGLRGCDFGATTHIQSADNTCGLNPAVSFTCPSEGLFTAMLGGFQQSTVYTATMGATSTSPMSFAAKVNDVFPTLEGSFYGNIFNLAAFNPNVRVEFRGRNEPVFIVAKGDGKHTGLGDPFIYPVEDTWSCHDPAWTAADAYLTSRLCAVVQVQPADGGALVPANLCVAQPLGPCNDKPADDPSNRCQIYDAPPDLGDIDHDDCIDGNGVLRKYPITVFLHQPCELLPREEQRQCRRK